MQHQSFNYASDIPVDDDVDVLVVGGGPSGIAAAVASARGGAKTKLIERHGFLGGNLTAGLVGPCMTSFSLDGETQLIRGIFEEFVQDMIAIGGALHPKGIPAGSAYASFIEYGHDKVTPFQPEAAKLVAQRMCVDAGVELLFYTMAVDALIDEAQTGKLRVDGVICASKGGLHLQPASVIIDCSADADIAAFAGAETRMGRDSDGLTQPMTQFFRVQNVDDDVVEAYVRSSKEYRPFSKLVEQARADGRLTLQRRSVGLYKTLERGVWRINTGRVLGRDGTTAAELTSAEVEGREQTMELLRFFQTSLPGFEKSSLLDTASQIGVRETRRIVGEYTLTEDDLHEGRSFADTVICAAYPIDIHDPTGAGCGLDGWNGTTANVYQVPYRVMVPKGHDGLLVAGRAISATHEALGAVRVMPPCFALGEAAGVAAHLAVAAKVQPRDVDHRELRETLRANGAYLGEEA